MAVEQVKGFPVMLEDDGVYTVTTGQEARHETTVKVQDNGYPVMGQAVTTDVVEASVLADVNGMSKIMAEQFFRRNKIPRPTMASTEDGG